MATTHAPLKSEYTFTISVQISEDDFIDALTRAHEHADETGEGYYSAPTEDEISDAILNHIGDLLSSGEIEAGENLDSITIEGANVQAEIG